MVQGFVICRVQTHEWRGIVGGKVDGNLVQAHICEPKVSLPVSGQTVGHCEVILAPAGEHTATYRINLEYSVLRNLLLAAHHIALIEGVGFPKLGPPAKPRIWIQTGVRPGRVQGAVARSRHSQIEERLARRSRSRGCRSSGCRSRRCAEQYEPYLGDACERKRPIPHQQWPGPRHTCSWRNATSDRWSTVSALNIEPCE
jgi:hypothetical protein